MTSAGLTLLSDEPMTDFSVFAIGGNQVMCGSLGGATRSSIDVGTLPAGTYFVRATTAGGCATVRFVRR